MRYESTATVAHLDDFDEIIDVRSPAEFALDHAPGAKSYPVLGNEERARVGTLYVQVSPFDARKLGAALVARNIASHIESEFTSRPANWRPLVYCWRGGKRSGAMAHILREIGWRASTLEGGYQSYRRAVVAELESLPRRFQYVVICGPTGSGKSHLLAALEAQGGQVLDLEALARHRGSVLGALPAEPQPSQKMFDSLLWQRLRKFNPAQPVFIEAESRRIGSVQLPSALLESMRAGRCARIEPAVAERVRFLIAEYRHLTIDPGLLKSQLNLLSALQPRSVLAHWEQCIDAGAWAELVTDLLERHYDPLYRRSSARNYPHPEQAPVLRPAGLDAQTMAESAAALMSQYESDAVAI